MDHGKRVFTLVLCLGGYFLFWQAVGTRGAIGFLMITISSVLASKLLKEEAKDEDTRKKWDDFDRRNKEQ